MTKLQTLQKLVELLKKVPPDIKADYERTNHFELQSPREEPFFWLCLNDLSPTMTFEDEEGKKVGLIMDILECAKRLESEITAMLVEAESDKGSDLC